MTTDSGWDSEMPMSDNSNAFTDVTPMAGHESGYCDLYRARRHGKWHVVKALKPQYRDTPACQAMLRKEFDIGFHLSHPCIATTLGLEQVEGLGECIIEEWVDGITLDQFIGNGTFTAEKAHHLVTQLCDALNYIHARQTTHRDLKPSNVLVTADGDRVKLIDFGVSDTATHAALKGPAGTRRYTAPEVLVGEKGDSRADIYSLGVLIDLMNANLPNPNRQLGKIAEWCMMPDRNQRPSSATEVLAALNSRNKFVSYLLIAAAIFGALMMVMTIAMVIRFAKPGHGISDQVPASDTTAVDTTVNVNAAKTTATEVSGDMAIPAPQHQTVQPSQPSVQEDKPVTLPPNLRQLFLAKAASVGMTEPKEMKETLSETLRLQGKDAFNRKITENLKEYIENRLMTEAVDMFQIDLSHNKAMREFLLTPEGSKLMDAGRKVAFEYAQDCLRQIFPDMDIPPFPNDKVNWFE